MRQAISYIFWIILAFIIGGGGVFLAKAGVVEMAGLVKSNQKLAEDAPAGEALPLGTGVSFLLASTTLPARTASLAFVGDIMLDRGVKASVLKNNNGDYRSVFMNIDKIRSADVLFGNLEGPVSDKGYDLGNLYSFRMSPLVLPILSEFGFKVLSVANNHAGDWQKEAFTDTLNNLQKYNISYIGGGVNYEETIKPKIIEKNGLKIGYLGFSDVGPNWLKAQTATAGILSAGDQDQDGIIKRAAEQVDVLVVSYHFGEEYQKTSNLRQKMLAHRAIDNGAKIVVGHHPHVPQELEQYNGGLIAYSLGNFIFDQYFSTSTMNGISLQVNLKDKTIESFATSSVHLNDKYQVSVD